MREIPARAGEGDYLGHRPPEVDECFTGKSFHFGRGFIGKRVAEVSYRPFKMRVREDDKNPAQEFPKLQHRGAGKRIEKPDYVYGAEIDRVLLEFHPRAPTRPPSPFQFHEPFYFACFFHLAADYTMSVLMKKRFSGMDGAAAL
jgi:hypothetical protein